MPLGPNLRLALLLLAAVPAAALVQVFGVGLSGTGTLALRAALQALGYQNIIHGDSGFAAHLPHAAPFSIHGLPCAFRCSACNLTKN